VKCQLERRIAASVDVDEVNGWKGVSVGIATAENKTKAGDAAAVTLDEEKKLYEEYRKANPKLVKKQDILRDHVLTLGGFKGREFVVKTEYGNGKIRYVFDWTYDGEVLSTARPYISIYSTFNDEQPESAAFDIPPPESQLLAMWDAVLNSLRWRKGA